MAGKKGVVFKILSQVHKLKQFVSFKIVDIMSLAITLDACTAVT